MGVGAQDVGVPLCVWPLSPAGTHGGVQLDTWRGLSCSGLPRLLAGFGWPVNIAPFA